MKKITAAALILALLVTGNANFVYAQEQKPEKLSGYKQRYLDHDKPVFIKAGFTDDDNLVLFIGMGVMVLAGIGLGSFGTLYVQSRNRIRIIDKELVNEIKNKQEIASVEMETFLKFQQGSTSKSINQAAMRLGKQVNPETYAMLMMDAACADNKMLGAALTGDTKLIEFVRVNYFRDIEQLLVMNPNAVVSRYTYAGRDTLFGSFHNIAKDAIKKELLKSLALFSVLFLITSVANAETQEKIKQIAMNENLAVQAGDDVLDAIDNMPDKTLQKSLIEKFDAAHEAALKLEAMPPQEQKDFASSAMRYQKEQNKVPVFDQRVMKDKQQEISKKYGADNLRVAH